MNTPPPGRPSEDECTLILVKMRLLNMTGWGWYELVQNYQRWLRGEPQQGSFKNPSGGGNYAFEWIWSDTAAITACLFQKHPELRPR